MNRIFKIMITIIVLALLLFFVVPWFTGLSVFAGIPSITLPVLGTMSYLAAGMDVLFCLSAIIGIVKALTA